ncbi:hypothetical protein [Amycolatopsis sp. A1MSW2902]|uniref:hypothetical protein n=1 Tax=Amycolatopsis sp. A1MSW2902 TaxID=687413 RepID=UPI00307EF05B
MTTSQRSCAPEGRQVSDGAVSLVGLAGADAAEDRQRRAALDDRVAGAGGAGGLGEQLLAPVAHLGVVGGGVGVAVRDAGECVGAVRAVVVGPRGVDQFPGDGEGFHVGYQSS